MRKVKGTMAKSSHKILVLDVGGTNIKVQATGHKQPRKIPSGPNMTAKDMVRDVKAATRDWKYDRVSIGYPGPVTAGHPVREPVKEVFKITETLIAALQADYVVLGGGNVKKLKKLPPGARMGRNENAILGGFRLWAKE
jgi:hypothetical protein